MCGFKIGKGCFIGMKCYFDDLCVDKIMLLSLMECVLPVMDESRGII